MIEKANQEETDEIIQYAAQSLLKVRKYRLNQKAIEITRPIKKGVLFSR